MKFGKITVLFSLVLFLLFNTACQKNPQKGGMPGFQGMPVKIEAIHKKDLDLTRTYVATLSSKTASTIYPRVFGPVSSILVEDGAYVKKGTPLFNIENSEQGDRTQASLYSSNASLKEVQASEESLKALQAEKKAAISSLDFHQNEFNRYSKLYELQSATKSTYDSYKNNLEQAQANLEKIDKNIQAAKLTFSSKKDMYYQSVSEAEADKKVLDYYTVRAPFSGYVGNISTNLGEYVTPQSPLTTLSSTNMLDIDIPVDVDLKNKLKIGMTIDLTDNNNNLIEKAVVYFISPEVKLQSQTLLIKAKVNNSKSTLKVNQVLNAKVSYGRFSGLTVPVESIINFAGQDFVYITDKTDKGLVAKQIPVKLGDIYNDEYMVLKGLKENQEIIYSGIQMLRDGVPIMITDTPKQPGGAPPKEMR